MSPPLDEARRRAAGRILDLAREFAARSRQTQLGLIGEFQSAVREHAAALGSVGIEDDDDEHLVLGADGRFLGRVLVTSEGLSRWAEIAGPGDVVDHYDPVDLFADLTDALLEQYPEAETEPSRGGGAIAPGWGGGTGALGSPDVAPNGAEEPFAETESASRRILRDLHAAGVYSDAEFAAKMAELERPGGS